MDLKTTSKKCARVLKMLGFDSKFKRFWICNIVSVFNIGAPILLEKLQKFLKERVEYGWYSDYEPEIFPALIFRYYQFEGIATTFLIFHTGKVVLTGCKTWE